MKPGDYVYTKTDVIPAASGYVVRISDCGRYVKVKTGLSKRGPITKIFLAKNLEIMAERGEL